MKSVKFNPLTSLVVAAALAIGLAACGGGSSSTTPAPAIAEREAIREAIAMAEIAVAAVNNDSTDAVVNAADAAIVAARNAITAAINVPPAERAAHTGTVDALASRLTTARMAARMAMVQTAMKLHAGISVPTATDTDTADTDTATGTRFARHAAADGADAGDIEVAIGDAANVFLSEDKETMVAAHHGWEGKRYTRTTPASDGTYEAVVYSNVGDPTEGAPFNEEYTLTGAGTDNPGEVAVDTSQTGAPARVASPSFDQSAGKKGFELPADADRVMISGSYHGVSGTYNCTPGQDQTCSATVAASGFTLEGGTWTFKPTDPEAKVMSTPDAIYASYGWWIHKSEDGSTFTASAFVDDMGEVPDATGITALQGTAAYVGGAAGKYALQSATGGTNDAGHFTASATLEADFGDDTITGTIDNFVGADGQSRNWSVELMEQGVGDTGTILGDDGTGEAKMTKWTIDGTAAVAAGQWSGSLKDNGDDDVPRVATGTFYSTYGTAGKMVGAFGANKE